MNHKGRRRDILFRIRRERVTGPSPLCSWRVAHCSGVVLQVALLANTNICQSSRDGGATNASTSYREHLSAIGRPLNLTPIIQLETRHFGSRGKQEPVLSRGQAGSLDGTLHPQDIAARSGLINLTTYSPDDCI